MVSLVNFLIPKQITGHESHGHFMISAPQMGPEYSQDFVTYLGSILTIGAICIVFLM